MKYAIAVVGLLAATQAQAAGCIEGAALGGVAGHLAHHTFLGIFGGCAGGMIVHHLYKKWHADHPNGTIKEFVAENKDKLPEGWADRLSALGDNAKLKSGVQ